MSLSRVSWKAIGCIAATAVLAVLLIAPGDSQVRPGQLEAESTELLPQLLVNGDLEDLKAAVRSNLNSSGLRLEDVCGDIGSPPQCQYFPNGADIDTGWVYVDFSDPGGTLWIGFEQCGVIGDADGDQNPDTFTNTEGPGGVCAPVSGDDPGIGPEEQYLIQIDTNCGDTFVATVTFAVASNDVFVKQGLNFIPIAGASFNPAAGGVTNLEVMIPNLTQLLMEYGEGFDPDACHFAIKLRGGFLNDGLAEDDSPAGTIFIPGAVSVTKTPPEQSACAGTEVSWLIEVCNEGSCPLDSMIVTDVLDAGLSYVSDTQGGEVDGQVIRWVFTDVQPDQCFQIDLTAALAAPCVSPVLRDSVHVLGVKEHPCLDMPEEIEDFDTALVNCTDSPCVELTCAAVPDSACANGNVDIAGEATNCSGSAEDITLVITRDSDGSVVNEQTFFDVAPGEQVQLIGTDTMPPECAEPFAEVRWNVEAKAVNECNLEGVIETCFDTVVCLPEPCVEVTCEAPEAACDGQEITVSGTAMNCSAGPEDITVTINGPSGPIGSLLFEAVPAGESVTHSETFVHDCDAVQPAKAEAADLPPAVIYYASATAVNSCGEISDLSEGCPVECLPEPCVELVCDVDKPEVCPGEEYTVTATATNCSDGVEDIVIYIDGESKLFEDVAIGAEVSFEWTFMAAADCPAGTETVHNTRAVATNVCNPDPGVEATCDVTVTCLPEPCVEVTCEAPQAACDGQEITVSGTAMNCSAGPEDITVTINGPSGPIGSLLFEAVPAGESVTHSETFVHDCDAVQPAKTGGRQELAETGTADLPPAVVYYASATATNSCGETSGMSEGCPVECSPEPCVELVCDVDKPEVCPGEEYTVTATATNCSDGVEDIVIYIDGESKLFEDVAIGAEVSFEWKFTAAADCPAGTETVHNTRAVATNVCNPDPGVEATCDVTVTCLPEPCIEVTCEAPEAACDGQEITVSGTAMNCSAGPEDITVTINGPSGPIGSLLFEAVPAGESVTHSETFIHDCDAVQPAKATAADLPPAVVYYASATATNSCGEISDMSEGCPVECLPEPCVELVCDVDKPEVCPGEEYTVTATATNCSDGAEDITIYIDGESKLFEDVAIGAEVSFEWTFTAAEDCPAGTETVHNTRAVATNVCNPDPGVEATCDVTVTCLPVPCVEVVCDVDKTEVCAGEEYTVSATATNCSDGVENIVIYIDGHQSEIFTDVAVGAEVNFQWTFNAPEDCEPLSTIPHAVRAVATNECNPDPGVEDTCDVAVTCQPAPCVTAACSVSDSEIDPGETATITGSAMNCSAGPEDIVLTIYGPDDLNAVLGTQTFTNVQPGAIVSLEADWTCPGGDTGEHLFRVGAVATNDCGTEEAASTDPCSISCTTSLCWLTGGGNHNDNNSKGQKLFTWGGNVGPPPRGSWEHVERDGEGNILFNFHAKDMEVYQCFHDGGDGPCHPDAENNVIIFGGDGEYSIGNGQRTEPAQFLVRAEDHGEPGNNPDRSGGCGSPDYYYIKVWKAGTTGDNPDDVIFEHGDFIDGGNLQIHPLKGNQGTN